MPFFSLKSPYCPVRFTNKSVFAGAVLIVLVYMEHLVKNTGAGIVKGAAAEFVLRIDIFYLDFKLKDIIAVLQFTGRCVDHIIIPGLDRVSGIIILDCIKSEIFKSLIIDGIFFRAGCVNVVIQIRFEQRRPELPS